MARARGTAFREVTVPVTSVDAVLGIGPLPKTLVFKIDVEGYEGHVLRGMQRTLAAAATAVGFIEFDPDMLTRAGEDMGQLWDTLQSHFDVAMFRGRNVVDLSGATWAAAAAQVQQAGNHTDLLLLGGQDRSSARRWSQQRYSTTRRAA